MPQKPHESDPVACIEDALEQLMVDPHRIPGLMPQGTIERPLPIVDHDGRLLAELTTMPDTEFPPEPMVLVDSSPQNSQEQEVFNYYYRDHRVVHNTRLGKERLTGEAAQARLCEKLTEIVRDWDKPDLGIPDEL